MIFQGNVIGWGFFFSLTAIVVPTLPFYPALIPEKGRKGIDQNFTVVLMDTHCYFILEFCLSVYCVELLVLWQVVFQ